MASLALTTICGEERRGNKNDWRNEWRGRGVNFRTEERNAVGPSTQPLCEEEGICGERGMSGREKSEWRSDRTRSSHSTVAVHQIVALVTLVRFQV